MLLENGPVCGQECCFVQDLPSKLSAASPAGISPSWLVGYWPLWVLTTAKRRRRPLRSLDRGSCLSSSPISQEAEGKSHLAKGLSVQCLVPERCLARMETGLSGVRTGCGRSCNVLLPTCKEWRALLGSHCVDEQVRPLLDTQMLSNQTLAYSCLLLSRSY